MLKQQIGELNQELSALGTLLTARQKEAEVGLTEMSTGVDEIDGEVARMKAHQSDLRREKHVTSVPSKHDSSEAVHDGLHQEANEEKARRLKENGAREPALHHLKQREGEPSHEFQPESDHLQDRAPPPNAPQPEPEVSKE